MSVLSAFRGGSSALRISRGLQDYTAAIDTAVGGSTALERHEGFVWSHVSHIYRSSVIQPLASLD